MSFSGPSLAQWRSESRDGRDRIQHTGNSIHVERISTTSGLHSLIPHGGSSRERRSVIYIANGSGNPQTNSIKSLRVVSAIGTKFRYPIPEFHIPIKFVFL